MKVESTNPLRPHAPRPAGKAGRQTGASFASALEASAEPGPAAALSGAAPVSGLDALLSLQSVEGRAEGERQAKEQAHRLLDGLDMLRADILSGEIPVARLERIAEMAGRVRAKLDDPRLAAIVDDVDLRAQVELAKLGFAPRSR